jgi:U3 small nucleolar ribonucleoprotein protein LCP5
MAAVPGSLSDLLNSLMQSLSLALEATPKDDQLERPDDGVSLLDTKNELLLAYLHNLVFLILVKIRHAKASGSQIGGGSAKIADTVINKLAELRLYLEKGVRPLEDRLGHTITRVLLAASDSERKEKLKELANISQGLKINNDGSDSDVDDDLSIHARGTEGPAAPGAANLLHFNVSKRPAERGMKAAASEEDRTGAYRPPKRNPIVMPEVARARRQDGERRAHKSLTMDEFISSEFSATPAAQPSIGTTIVSGGRKTKTDRERKEEDERREYEEMNFVRLPKASKKDRAKVAKQEGRRSRMNFGGEEWRELGEGVDRIDRLTRRKEGPNKGTRALLEKSRKRERDSDGPNGNGAVMGERFQKKLKVMEMGRRDKSKGRK